VPRPAILDVSPGIVDPAGGSHVEVTGTALGSVTSVSIGGVAATSIEHVDDQTLRIVTAPVAAGTGLVVSVDAPVGTTDWSGALESWSPAEIASARVFDASFGATGTETADTYQWSRLTTSIAPDWLHRDGPGLVYLPDTGRFWMIAGWSPYDAPDGWGALEQTTNEVWSSEDGVTWQRELEHGNAEFVRRHFQGTLVWRDRAWLVGGDIFSTMPEAYSYQHDIYSSADGVDWDLELAQTPWSDRIFEVAGIFNDQMWVVGGQTGLSSDDSGNTQFYNDVWRSDDGVTWTEVAPNGPPSATRWSPRGVLNKMVEFNGELWLVGGGTYQTYDVPIQEFPAEAWSTTDGVTWTEHSVPWSGRIYHTVEVFDGKLWVIGGCHETTCNSNDAWYTEDGENWTEIPYQRSPQPVSHGDGVAVGPDFLLFAGGNYTFGVGAGADNSAWRLTAFGGTAVESWVDRASGLEVTATGDMRPVLDADAFGAGRPGMVFDGLDHALELDASDIQPDGRSVFFVAKAPYNLAVADTYSPANTVVGDSVDAFCAAGLSQGALAYTDGANGWQTATAGEGYQDGPDTVISVGFTHAADGTVQAYGEGVPVGDPTVLGYNATYEGWRTIGASYGLSSHFVGTLGAVVILPEAADADTAARIDTWAQGRFGSP
jgi:hypothetical protein